MSVIKEVLGEAASALCLSTLIEGVLIDTFLAGVLVAFALAVMP